MLRSRQLTIFLFILSLIIFLDQYTKYLILLSIAWGEIYAITPFLSLVLAFNKGISFGMMNAPEQQQWILISLSGMVVIMLLYMLYKNPKKYSYIAIALIIGGAVGNVIDRIIYGAVVDFIDFHYLRYHFPVFNVADISICCGVALMIYLEFRKDILNK